MSGGSHIVGVAGIAALCGLAACANHVGPTSAGSDDGAGGRGSTVDGATVEQPRDAPAAADAASASDDAAEEADAAAATPDANPATDVRPADARAADARADAGPVGTSDAGAGGTSDAGAGGAARCKGSALAVCESFEDTAVGALPAGWGRRSGWGGKTMAVAADAAARGAHALKIEGGATGSQFLEYRQPLGGLATEHWGRIFFRVKVPAPWPAAGVLHGDIVQHLGPHPGGGTNGVRWGIVENTQMKFQWIYNVQPTQGEMEFGDGTAYNYGWPDRWQCLEWHYSQPMQSGAVWLDGTQLPIQVGRSHVPEIPVFTSLGVGWANYQNAAGEGFVVWIDEVAFDPNRIGCAN